MLAMNIFCKLRICWTFTFPYIASLSFLRLTFQFYRTVLIFWLGVGTNKTWFGLVIYHGLKYLLNRKKILFFVNTNRLEVWSLLQNTPWWHANKLRPLDWTWTLVSWLKVLRLTQRYLLFQRSIWSPNFLLCSHHNNNSAQVTTNVNTNQPVFQLTLTKKLLLLTWPQWIVVFYWSPRSNGFRFDKGVIYWFVIE